MAMNDRDSNCSSNFFVSSEDVFEDDENSIQKRSSREKLHRRINQVCVHTAIVVIVLVQLLIIAFLLLIHFEVIRDPPTSRTDADVESASQENRTGQFETESSTKEVPVEEVEDALNALNVVILCVFLAEIFLRVVAKGFSIIHDKLQVFDSAVVLVVSLLYMVLLAADTKRSAVYGVAYLIVLRLWRIGRIHRDITERERRKAERVINTHRKAAKDAEQYARSMIAKVEQQQGEPNYVGIFPVRMALTQIFQQEHEITTLREHIKVLKQNKANSSPALRSVSQHTYTPDDPGTSEDEFDQYDKHTKKMLEMVTVELSNGHVPTPNGSLPSGTPNGSVPNMTPTSSCSYLTGEGTDPDKVSNKFPDLVEQAQGLEVKETFEGQGDTHELQGNSDTQSGAKDPSKLVINAASPKSNSSQAPDKTLQANNQESMSHADNGNYAYSNADFQPDSESQGQDQSQTVPENSQEGQLVLSLPDPKKSSAKSKYEDFGSTTYLNQDGIPMTDL